MNGTRSSPFPFGGTEGSSKIETRKSKIKIRDSKIETGEWKSDNPQSQIPNRKSQIARRCGNLFKVHFLRDESPGGRIPEALPEFLYGFDCAVIICSGLCAAGRGA